jgi:hypothetical protein
MTIVPGLRIITGAWADVLSSFVAATRRELLVASPWITAAAARLISHQLSSIGPVTLQILARMDACDFLSGSSHILAFRENTYPGHVRVVFRALPMLHGKMLVADRQRVIVGSANLTEGGLYRNHEISLQGDSNDLGEACAQEFFRLWSAALPVPDGYLDRLESALTDALPVPEDGIAPQATVDQRKSRKTGGQAVGFRYVRPPGASAARTLIAQALRLPPPADFTHEDRDAALHWLERSLKFVSIEQRGTAAVVHRSERLMYHPDIAVRATAVDRAGRSGNRSFLPRLQALATNVSEPPEVRSAATFALGLLGSPEAFQTLVSLLQEAGDTGRWARRGCFLLINDVDRDGQLSMLGTLAVEDPTASLAMAKACDVGRGTVAERLTKALVVEQYSTARWDEGQVASLVCVMALAASAIVAAGRKVNVGAIAKETADALGVRPGDLRHGPLSPSLLQRITESGLADPGLAHLIGNFWQRVQQSTPYARETLSSQPAFGAVLKVLDGTESNKGMEPAR